MFPVFSDHYHQNFYTTVFDVCDRMVCINITLFNDNILDHFDWIEVYLYTYHSLISYNVSYLNIEVQDDDDGELFYAIVFTMHIIIMHKLCSYCT